MKKIYKIILSFILWSAIIAIPQYNWHYTAGLITGKLKYGEIPVEFYLGLFSGLFGALLFWGLAILITKLISRTKFKDVQSHNLFFGISITFFVFVIYSQGEVLYKALTLEESKVREVQQMVRDYRSNQIK